MKDLLIIGGSGFSGKRLCAILNSMGMRFDALVRRSTDTGLVGKYAQNLVAGDITDVQDLAEVLQGYKRCIHIPDLARVKDAERYIEVYSESAWRRLSLSARRICLPNFRRLRDLGGKRRRRPLKRPVSTT